MMARMGSRFGEMDKTRPRDQEEPENKGLILHQRQR